MHGHDFAAVAFLPERDAYAAAAEEKVVRVLEAPHLFFDTLSALCGVCLQPRQVCAAFLRLNPAASLSRCPCCVCGASCGTPAVDSLGAINTGWWGLCSFIREVSGCFGSPSVDGNRSLLQLGRWQ